MKTFKRIPESHCLSTFSTTGLPLMSRDIFIMEEIWKSIKGYEKYQINNLGIVKKIKNNQVLVKCTSTDGYYYYHLSNDSGKRNVSVHRLISIHFIPNPENKPCVNHIDANKKNNSIDNLEWCTHKENMQHAAKLKLINGHGKKKLIDIKTGEKYKSISEAGEKKNIDKYNLANMLRGLRNNYTNLRYDV